MNTKYAKANSVRDWFMRNDVIFGISLISMKPEDAGLAMKDRYGISIEGLSEGTDALLLERLNGLT